MVDLFYNRKVEEAVETKEEQEVEENAEKKDE